MSTAPDTRAAEVFFALGDRTRLSVVHKLGKSGASTATDLSDGAGVSRQAIVKHLQVLERAGIVGHRKRGREVLYALETRRLKEAQDFLGAVSAGWDRALERLRELVEAPSPSDLEE